jgi:hypothetical protein
MAGADANPKPARSYLQGINLVPIIILLIIGGALLAVIAIRVREGHESSGWVFKNTPRLIYQNVVSGPLNLTAGENRYWTIYVDPQTMHMAHVVGRFQMNGGTEDDIQIVLADANEFENWEKGLRAQTLYLGEQITSGTFDVRLTRAGTYTLSLRNTSSAEDKKVSAEIRLRYLAPPMK